MTRENLENKAEQTLRETEKRTRVCDYLREHVSCHWRGLADEFLKPMRVGRAASDSVGSLVMIPTWLWRSLQ